MFIDMQQCCRMLGTADDILILCHKSPDGDTVGAAYGLYHALTRLGRRAAVRCSDPWPERFRYLTEAVEMPEFDPKLIVAVDIAGENLLGDGLAGYAGRIDLCIDHHVSNTDYAACTLLDAKAAAACEIMYSVIRHLGVPVTKPMADALYTGCITDTGCFRYSNTTAETLRTAAELIEAGADSVGITTALFETVSRLRMALENRVMDTLEYHFDGRCASIVMGQALLQELGAKVEDLEGIVSIPRRIEGVQVAVAFRENPSGSYKISVRTGEGADASAICRNFGGGGHMRAAGCNVPGPLEHAQALLLDAIGKELNAQ